MAITSYSNWESSSIVKSDISDITGESLTPSIVIDIIFSSVNSPSLTSNINESYH